MDKVEEKAPAQAKTSISKVEPGGGGFGSWYPFGAMLPDFQRMFEDFGKWPNFPGFPEMPNVANSGLPVSPASEWSETDKAYELTCEVPGMDESDVDVSVGRDMLTIKGEKKSETEKEEGGHKISERRYGMIQRSFRLPDSVDKDKIEGHVVKGVLKVTMPKLAESVTEERKIKIGKA